MSNKVELLAPAGNLEKLKIAILYGADAVYLGGKKYSLRSSADNFTLPEIEQGLDFAHKKGAKVYVTINIFAHNQDLEGLPHYLKYLEHLGIDGIIFSDPGVWKITRELNSKLSLHLSTQANTTNWASAQFWEKQGVKRLVLARELSLSEIKEICQKVGAEIEVFVHGAMCISYSGRCLLSNYLAGRDANLGECAQPCRWHYYLYEGKRPNQNYPLVEDERGSYIFNAQDLCLIRYLPDLIRAGVNSFKIEGRMKSIHYVATIVQAYRQALDTYYYNPDNYQFNESWYDEIMKVSHRDYTTGFLWGKPQSEAQNYQTTTDIHAYDFIGLIQTYEPNTKLATVEQRNNFRRGDLIEIISPQSKPFCQIVKVMYNEAGSPIAEAPHPQQIVRLAVEHPVEPWGLIRKIKAEGGEKL